MADSRRGPNLSASRCDPRKSVCQQSTLAAATKYAFPFSQSETRQVMLRCESELLIRLLHSPIARLCVSCQGKANTNAANTNAHIDGRMKSAFRRAELRSLASLEHLVSYFMQYNRFGCNTAASLNE